jgi:tetratricopeptide (TPR) repeat protein
MTRISTMTFALIAIAAAAAYWPLKPTIDGYLGKSNNTEDDTSAHVLALLADYEPKQALKIIKHHRNHMEDGSSTSKQWLNLFITASEQVDDVAQLRLLYEYAPKLFTSHEKAALLVANHYIKSAEIENYHAMRQQWQGREEHSNAWTLLDADALLFEGQRSAAIAMLEEQHFEGKDDSARLTRLGLLNVVVNPAIAWEYFSEAISSDPDNADLYIYRAKLLEIAEKPDLALQEFAMAMQIKPRDPWLYDQLAEFYNRHGDNLAALQVWQKVLNPPSKDTIWLKALFWSHILQPINFQWQRHPIPEGTLTSLIEYLLKLPPGEFWNTQQFANLPYGNHYLSTEQATYWMRLLDYLKHGQERSAMQLIEYNPFQKESWNPALERALLRTLSYRLRGTLNIGEMETALAVENKEVPSALLEFEQYSDASIPIPPSIEAHLNSAGVFADLLVAAGWKQAADLLRPMPPVSNEESYVGIYKEEVSSSKPPK